MQHRHRPFLMFLAFFFVEKGVRVTLKAIPDLLPCNPFHDCFVTLCNRATIAYRNFAPNAAIFRGSIANRAYISRLHFVVFSSPAGMELFRRQFAVLHACAYWQRRELWDRKQIMHKVWHMKSWTFERKLCLSRAAPQDLPIQSWLPRQIESAKPN